MSAQSYSVAIVGGTGLLGAQASRAFLSDFKSSFHTVRVLTRDPSSTEALDLASKGAQLYQLDESNLPRSLDGAFKGVDVIVNALSGGTPAEVKEAVLAAAARSEVKVYFLAEYGLDHRINDHDGFEHPVIIKKQKFATETRKLLQGRKVIALYVGLFLEFVLTPYMGVDLARNTYICVGSPGEKFTLTAAADIGRSIARLAILSLDQQTAARVPDDVRITGQAASYEEIRDTVARVKGVPPAEVTTKDLNQFKDDIIQEPDKDFFGHLKLVIAEGKGDFSSDNANSLVNPGESFWKWKTVEEHVRGL
ncbi:NAD(P)-binding protein [Cubamyces sp. BRFM 1775]|nr:NAD(P)-binding protein [Cubamyces sp. BRFM 1775]